VEPAKRILVVEDDAYVREALADALRDAGLHVDVAVDGLDGLARLRAGPTPAVVLLDEALPKLRGEELLRTMRGDEAYEHVPVITMSALPDGRHDADTDVVAHLHKPFDVQDLLQIVLSLVGASVV
jgi:CheY-like chemotaxis protein